MKQNDLDEMFKKLPNAEDFSVVQTKALPDNNLNYCQNNYRVMLDASIKNESENIITLKVDFSNTPSDVREANDILQYTDEVLRGYQNDEREEILKEVVKLFQREINMNANYHKGMLSNEFVKKMYKSAFLYNSVCYLDNGGDPYQIVEQLVDTIEDQNKKLENLYRYGIPPIIITTEDK